MNDLPTAAPFEEKQLTVLRRKFLVGIPMCSVLGYFAARATAARFGLSAWPRRIMNVAGVILTPIVGSMVIVHFNRAEIFRVGNSIMRQMEELRKLEEGPFRDPTVRQQWDSQMENRQFKMFRQDVDISKEYSGGVDYNRIIEDSVGK